MSHSTAAGRVGTTAALLLLIGFLLTPHAAFAAGTAYAVDTAEVGDRGDCKVEAWASLARNRDLVATLSPSCIVSSMPRTELVMQSTRSRADDEWATSLSPFVKINLVPTAIGRLGFAAVGGSVHDAVRGETSSLFAYVPATLRLSETMRVNINGGWLNDRPADRHFATWGIGWDWLFMPRFSLTLEGFGQLAGQDLGWQTRPRFQGGVRYRPIDAFSVDLIYGRNIAGEGSHWLTLSTAYRFKGF